MGAGGPPATTSTISDCDLKLAVDEITAMVRPQSSSSAFNHVALGSAGSALSLGKSSRKENGGDGSLCGASARSALPLWCSGDLLLWSWALTANRQRQCPLLLRLRLQRCDACSVANAPSSPGNGSVLTITSATEARCAHHDLNGATKV